MVSEEQLHRVEVPFMRRQVQAGHVDIGAGGGIDSVVEQEVDDVVVAIRTRPDESLRQLFLGCRRREFLHAIEPADTSGIFEVEIRAMRGEKSGSQRPAVGQASTRAGWPSVRSRRRSMRGSEGFRTSMRTPDTFPG